MAVLQALYIMLFTLIAMETFHSFTVVTNVVMDDPLVPMKHGLITTLG